ncbi:sensor histidine kinase [Aquabacter sp. P-9]|uniref:sensor histidine kinase n=1 Tax=Aquabacter sediminis TaxID=3029197 RepID=UPI00237E5D81|nr:sensor histidine kinase [Aquabacter sp. P-9]MDE1570515.1 sensor histidine kinase [Aquabacter sp. P-9]
MRWLKGEAARARNNERAALFASAVGQPRHLLDSVRRGLILVILVAIMPIATAAMLQGVLQLRRSGEEAQHKLQQGAIVAAAGQDNIFTSAENVLQALKNVPQVTSGGAECQSLLYGATLSLPFASNVAMIGRDGIVRCSALPSPNPNVSQRPWWRDAIREKGFSLSARIISPVTRGEILPATLPLFDAGSELTGALSVAIDGVWLDNLLKREAPVSSGVVAVINRAGQELVSNAPALSRALFKDRDLLAHQNELGEAWDESGQSWSYAIAPLDRYGLTVAFAQPTSQLFQWTAFHVAVSFILPICMVIFTIVAIWLATDRMVLQWLLYLRRVTAVYAQGHYGFRPSRMDQAPSEFRVLGNAIEEMAQAIRERDGRLREGLAEKTALVREIHHRIKNSLQIVVSLMSLYGSGLANDKDRRRFDQLRTRVNTLAVVHRVLYEANEGSEVRSRELLRELGSLLEVALDRNVLVLVEADDVALPTDYAVPLALLLTEIMMVVAAGEHSGQGRVVVTCAQEGNDICLRLDISRAVGDALNETHAPLAHGFARQLGGAISTREEGGHSLAELRFKVRPKTP